MKDNFGNELAVGDWIAFAPKRHQRLYRVVEVYSTHILAESLCIIGYTNRKSRFTSSTSLAKTVKPSQKIIDDFNKNPVT